MTEPAQRSIRIVPELRAVHLERYHETTPALMLYIAENYDLKGAVVPDEIRRVRLRDLVRLFWETDCTILEAPEPLWMRFLPRGIFIVATFKLTGAMRRRRRIVATYAMENNTLRALIGGNRRVPRIAVHVFAVALGLYIRTSIDRMAFASTGSRDLYLSIPGVSALETVTVDELPSAVESTDRFSPDPVVTFIGVLETRKGVELLLEAWEIVETTLPAAILQIIGPGPLHTEVEQWSASAPTTRKYLGQLAREEVIQLLSRTRVLAAPSLPSGRWREQIGLPIKEGLSRGATVVTTRQTGLAEWLAANGHRVIDLADQRAMAGSLAAELVAALDHPLDRAAVRASLPTIQGRYEADAWLHRQPERTTR